MVRENPKPFQNNLRLVHGLLSCKNCANVWNRDCNGAKNIYKIAYNSIHMKFRRNQVIYVEIHQVYYTIHQNQNLHVLKQATLVDFFVGKTPAF